MLLFQFLLVVHAIIATALVGVILMQRSEGGGLAGGGSPAGLVSARGAADLMTRTTAILATLFILLSIGMAALATVNRAPKQLDTSLATQAPAVPAQPVSSVPLADPGPAAVTPAAVPATKEKAKADTPKQVAPKPVAKPAAAPAPAAKAEAPKPAATPAPAEPAPAPKAE
jgi:preprotein translocase subunit SecG